MKNESLLPESLKRGLIIAPAGCGKTQSIIDFLSDHTHNKPILVLTHTNAGVAALKNRLDKYKIPSSRYRLATIDGWALRLVTTFPMRSGYSLIVPDQINYPAVRRATIQLLEGKHILECLQASYSQILVDEYQDCSTLQHTIIRIIAEYLPTYVLGDPLQAIFRFDQNDPLASWGNDVCGIFPICKELDIPWRWINAGNEVLGKWLLYVRQSLLQSTPIDLQSAPECVRWIKLEGNQSDHMKRISAAGFQSKADEQVLIIGDSRNPSTRHLIASQVFGASVVEPVDLRDMVSFCRDVNLEDANLLERVLRFTETLMTNVGTNAMLDRIRVLQAGTARKEASSIELAALNLIQNRTFQSILNLINEISIDKGTRIYRHEVLRCFTKALSISEASPTVTLHAASIQVREQNRMIGRKTRKRSVGSTLLLKGLEADTVVILNADELDRYNLYVAMTRGSKNLVICSRESILRPN